MGQIILNRIALTLFCPLLQSCIEEAVDLVGEAEESKERRQEEDHNPHLTKIALMAVLSLVAFVARLVSFF